MGQGPLLASHANKTITGSKKHRHRQDTAHCTLLRQVSTHTYPDEEHNADGFTLMPVCPRLRVSSSSSSSSSKQETKVICTVCNSCPVITSVVAAMPEVGPHLSRMGMPKTAREGTLYERPL